VGVLLLLLGAEQLLFVTGRQPEQGATTAGKCEKGWKPSEATVKTNAWLLKAANMLEK
jgi:hypothetical protein